MKGFLFFDVDGTIINSKDGELLPTEEVIQAIHKAKENGYLCFLSTGRNEQGIDILKNVGLDGYICSDGSIIVIEGRETILSPIPTEKVDVLKEQVLEKFKGSLILSTQRQAFGAGKSYDAMMEEIIKVASIQNREVKEMKKEYGLSHLSEYQGETVVEIDVAFPNEEAENQWIKEMDPELKFISTSASYGRDEERCGEVIMQSVSKAAGCRKIVEIFKGDMKDTYAFGDSMNDGEMLKECQVGIAMGNAVDELKEIADCVTDTVQNDGVVSAMKKYEII